MTYSELIRQLQKIKKDEKLDNPEIKIYVNHEEIDIDEIEYDSSGDVIVIHINYGE